MSTEVHSAQESIAVDQDADHDELVTAVAQLAEQNRQLREENVDLRQEVEDLREQVETNTESIHEQARNNAEDRQRLTDAEDRLDDCEEVVTSNNTQGSDGTEPAPETCVMPETPLERTTALPQEMIDQESANVGRAVFVAKDVADYTTKVPAGRAIRSSELRRVLKAGTDCRGHSQTVDRVIAVLNDLGSDEVEVVDRRGERRVVFTEQIVERLEELTAEQEASHDVVTRGEV
jgi:phage-related minor tail protein